MTKYILFTTEGKFHTIELHSKKEIAHHIGTNYFTLNNGDLELYLNPKAGIMGKKSNIWVIFFDELGFEIPYVYGDVILGSKKELDVAKYKKILITYKKINKNEPAK